MKTVIAIATYNEKENIERLIREIFNLSVENLSVLVVDDGSPDGTGQIVDKLRLEFSNLDIIHRAGKQGLGTAYVAALKKILPMGVDTMVIMDADFSHQPKDIPRLLAEINGDYDLVIGSRKIKGGKIEGWNIWRTFCSNSAMMVSRLVLGIKAKDVSNSFRAYNLNIFNKINPEIVKSKGYDVQEELLYLIEKSGFRVKEIPITFIDRQAGESKFNFSEIINFFKTILRIKLQK